MFVMIASPGRRLFLLLVIAVATAAESAHSGYQACIPATCAPQTYNIATPTLDVYLVSAATCKQFGADSDETLTDYASLKTGANNVYHGGESSVVGQYCVYKYCSGSNCTTWAPQNRNIDTIRLYQVSPSGSSTYFPLRYNPIPP